MPAVEANGTSLYYEEHGAGDETIVFSHGLLMSSEMYRAQIDALKGEYRCIAFDHRGQGRSEITENGYDMDNVARDASGLIRALDAAPCHLVGLSMGGFVGQRLAIHHPELLRSLTLIDTSADPELDEHVGPYRRLAFIGRWFGFRPIAGRIMNILFGRTFMTDPGRESERQTWTEWIAQSDRKGSSRAAHGVIDREGVYERLGDVRTPTLIIVGDEDVATPPDQAQRIHQKIAGSRLVVIPGAGHHSPIERPEAVTKALKEFLHDR